MKNLFLTSGLVLCLACPAFADIAAGTSSANCDESVLDSYTGPVDFGSDWRPVISDAITLNSDRYTSNSGTSVQSATTNLSPATVYEVYGVGVYSTQPTVATLDNFTTSNRLTTLTTLPQMTGYNFAGVYTTKATDGIQVIDSSGNFLYDDTSTQVTTEGGTTTWFTRWTAKNDIAVSYAAGTASNPNNPNSATHTPTGSTASQTATYDSSLTLAANGFTAPDGYMFEQWKSPKVLTTGASETMNYGAGASINPWKVADNITLTATWTPIKYTITYQDNTSDTLGTALYGSLNGSVPSQQPVLYDDTVNLTSMTGTRTGYIFGGWTGDKNVRTVDGTGSTQYGGSSITYLYPGNVTLTANWGPAKSGAITLISNVYPSNDTSKHPIYTPSTTEAVTPVTTDTIYSIYNNGLYKDISLSTPMVASEEIPVKAGYSFTGFYDSSMVKQFITSGGAATDAGKRAVTANDGTDKWYAGWEANQYDVFYYVGTCAKGRELGQRDIYHHIAAATYDSDWKSLKASSRDAPYIYEPRGWTFDGWTKDERPEYTGNSLNNEVIGYRPWKLTDNLRLYGACTPNISGAITLDSMMYASAFDTIGTAATTNASASTLYSVYDYGIYTTQPTKETYPSATEYTQLTTRPKLTGYTFQGFYTGKAGSGTRVINADGTFTDYAKTRVTTAGGTATWYAHYTVNTYNITYGCGSAPSGASESVTGNNVPSNGSATYGSSYTLSATYGDCALPGYTATGWDCSGGAVLSNATGSQSTWSSAADIACTVHWTPNTINLNYYQDTVANGATTPFTTDTCTYDTTFDLPTNYQPKNGYHFNGWVVRQ